MDRRPLLIVLSFLLVGPARALGQDVQMPTAQQFTERAAAAAAAPLFATHDLLKLTLSTDISRLRRERNDTLELEGTATYTDQNGAQVSRPVQVRVRGNNRLNPSVCNFPPLRLNFPRGQLDGTVFEGQDRLKLVTPCQDDRDEYQRYIYDEYLAYRVLNLLTPYSYRVRFVEVTYEDPNGGYDTRTKRAFLIESDDQMAERNRAVFVETPQMHPMLADGYQSVLGGLFNYMIGNLDWSAVYFHNAVVVQLEDGRYVTVPYDFDYAGVVNTRYAVVPEQLQDRVRRVRQRLYREFCRPQLTFENAASMFLGHRSEIEELYRTFPYYAEPSQAEDALEYYEDFWQVLTDDGDFEDEILGECTPLPR